MWEEKKVLEGEIIPDQAKVDVANQKVQEFAKEFNDLQDKYRQYFTIGLVNKVNKQGEVNPEIKLILK